MRRFVAQQRHTELTVFSEIGPSYIYEVSAGVTLQLCVKYHHQLRAGKQRVDDASVQQANLHAHPRMTSDTILCRKRARY